jgi:hypothetical protein
VRAFHEKGTRRGLHLWLNFVWMGIRHAVGDVAGMTAPVVAGYLVGSSGHYTSWPPQTEQGHAQDHRTGT